MALYIPIRLYYNSDGTIYLGGEKNRVPFVMKLSNLTYRLQLVTDYSLADGYSFQVFFEKADGTTTTGYPMAFVGLDTQLGSEGFGVWQYDIDGSVLSTSQFGRGNALKISFHISDGNIANEQTLNTTPFVLKCTYAVTGNQGIIDETPLEAIQRTLDTALLARPTLSQAVLNVSALPTIVTDDTSSSYNIGFVYCLTDNYGDFSKGDIVIATSSGYLALSRGYGYIQSELNEKEDLANKKTIINDTTADTDNVNYPSVKAVKDYVDSNINQVELEIDAKEDKINKKSVINNETADDANVNYPSVKAVKTYIDNITEDFAENYVINLDKSLDEKTITVTQKISGVQGAFTFKNGHTVDTELSLISPNPVQNSTVTTSLNTKLSQKPDGVNDLITDGKINLSYLPQYIKDGLTYGGTVNGSGLANLSANAKSILGVDVNTLQLADSSSAVPAGYVANDGLYYLVTSSGNFANLDLRQGDWLVGSSQGWQKIDNTEQIALYVASYIANIGLMPISGTETTVEATYTISDTEIDLQIGGFE